MAKHTMVTFQLHRIGVILVVVFLLVLAVLIFATGFILGTRRAPKPIAITPAPASAPSTTQPPTSSPAPPPRLTIRLAAFATEEEATAALESLTKRGIKPELVPLTAGESTLYTLTTGRYATHAEATKAVAALEKQGVGGGTVVALGE